MRNFKFKAERIIGLINYWKNWKIWKVVIKGERNEIEKIYDSEWTTKILGGKKLIGKEDIVLIKAITWVS